MVLRVDALHTQWDGYCVVQASQVTRELDGQVKEVACWWLWAGSEHQTDCKQGAPFEGVADLHM